MSPNTISAHVTILEHFGPRARNHDANMAYILFDEGAAFKLGFDLDMILARLQRSSARLARWLRTYLPKNENQAPAHRIVSPCYGPDGNDLR